MDTQVLHALHVFHDSVHVFHDFVQEYRELAWLSGLTSQVWVTSGRQSIPASLLFLPAEYTVKCSDRSARGIPEFDQPVRAQ